jgi:tripartite-type tricarboxylate transporter receptor subunit TctC
MVDNEENSMKMRHRRVIPLICGALVAAILPVATARAADWPDRPIRMLVGFAPGGGTDATARAIAPKLSELLGQQVIVDNRPGATGNIATDIVSKSNPDGYTILMGTIAALAINPSLYEKLPFDPIKDLAPVTRAVDSTNVLVLHPSVPAKSVKELIALAKSKSLNCGSSGVGGAGHLALELFNLQTGTKIVHVPYKGGGPAMIDLLGGNIQLIFATAASAVGHFKSGKIRALAVTTLKRSPLVPDLPTVAETGLKGFEANNWYGVLVPAKTSRAIVMRLNKDVSTALLTPDVKELLFKQGLDVAPETPEAFGAYIKSEIAKWAKVIKAAGLKAEP